MVLDGKKEWQIVKKIKLRIFSHELSSINFEVRFEIGLKVTLSLSVSLSGLILSTLEQEWKLLLLKT